MSLFTATLIPGLVLLAAGAFLFLMREKVEKLATKSLRSMPAAIFTMGLGGGWFLYHVAQLGEADFGNYRTLLLVFFLGVGLLSFFHVRDFLAVRGAAILWLLIAKVLLDAAFMQPQTSRLLLVGLVYIGILLALYLGTVPFRLRDFFDWLFGRESRVKFFGSLFAGYGLVLCLVSFTY